MSGYTFVIPFFHSPISIQNRLLTQSFNNQNKFEPTSITAPWFLNLIKFTINADGVNILSIQLLIYINKNTENYN